MKTAKTARPADFAIGIALAVAAALPAAAQQMPVFTFSGYGTLGLAHSDNDQADYLPDQFKPTGPGHSRGWSYETDTRVGGQVSAEFTAQVSGVVQVLVQQRHDRSWTPIVEWANLKYQVNPDLSARAGRVVLPIFMVTDSRRVGYANPWVRPPVEAYSLVPVTSVDGADASWRLEAAGLRNTFQLTAGRLESHFPDASGFDPGKVTGKGLFALADTIEHGPATLRVSFGRASLTIANLDPLFDAFRQFGPPGEDIAARFEVNDTLATFVGVGASYDPGPWFAMAEWTQFDTRSVLGKKTAWYASGGARFGNVTPYATYARIRPESPLSDPGLPVAAYPPQAQPIASMLNAQLNTLLALPPQQRTLSVGLRWDFLRNAALKVQYDDVRLDDGGYGTFGNLQPGFEPGGRTRIFSAVVDFLF